MGRTGRRDDPSYWLANRRKFHDDLDKLCRSVNERQDMTDSWWLAEKLLGMSKSDCDVLRDGVDALRYRRQNRRAEP